MEQSTRYYNTERCYVKCVKQLFEFTVHEKLEIRVSHLFFNSYEYY